MASCHYNWLHLVVGLATELFREFLIGFLIELLGDLKEDLLNRHLQPSLFDEVIGDCSLKSSINHGAYFSHHMQFDLLFELPCDLLMNLIPAEMKDVAIRSGICHKCTFAWNMTQI